MSKSKYPNQIDTSVELPVVRDNITQINSSLINSLRSAILNIEKTLGINPQGGSAGTVASRISQTLDDSGNIKPDAISKVGLLSGPITDRDVADSANIKESKINLDYPTSLLYSEISGTFGVLKDVLSQLEELNRSISSHITEDAPNRHNAGSIRVKAISGASSSTSLSNFSESDLQDILEKIISTHINLNSSSASSINNAHPASQIFFNPDRSSNVSSTNVQDAIEDLSNLETLSFAKTLLKICSNGILRKGKIFDAQSGNEGFPVVSESGCNYIVDSSPYTELFFNSPQTQEYVFSKMDIAKISFGTNIKDEYFIIKDATISAGKVESITLFGSPSREYNLDTKCQIFKNYYKSFNMAGFLPVARPNVSSSNDSNVAIIDPSSATVIGNPIYFQYINDDEVLNIEVDGETYNIPLYYSNIPFTYKNMDTAIYSINQYCADNFIPLLATKIRYDSCYSIVISHMIPNFSSDIKKRYIKILTGTSEKLALSSYLNKEIVGENGGLSFINGEFLGIKNSASFDSSIMNVSNLSNKISIRTGRFSDYGIDSNSFIYIDNYDGNNGMYSIVSMDDQTITLDSTRTFSYNENANPVFIFVKNCLNVSELEFQEIGGTDGEILTDIFMSDNGTLGLQKRLEVSNINFENNFSFCISDVSKDFIEDSSYRLNIASNLYANISDLSGNSGPSVLINASGTYKIFDATGLRFVVIEVFSDGTNIGSNKVCEIYGYPELPKSLLRIGRFPYTTNLGKIIGVSENSGVPAIKDKRQKGVISESDISESFIEKFIEGPRNELRGSGVVRGCEVVNLSYSSGIATFDIQPGIIYVNGIRYPYYGQQNIKFETNLNFYIVFNQDGCLEIVNEVRDPDESDDLNISPYKNQDVLHLAHINLFFRKISKTYLNLNNLDYKKSLDSISVSKDNPNAHFKSIQEALDFITFSEKIYKNKITKINILEGEYIITEPLTIDSYVEMVGVGKVIIYRDSNYNNLSTNYTEDFDFSNCLIQIGKPGSFNFMFSGKTVISNITFQNNSNGITCSILNHLNYNANENGGFEVKNCTFLGPDNCSIPISPLDTTIADIPIVFTSKTDDGQLLYDGAMYRDIYIHSNVFYNSGWLSTNLIAFLIRESTIDILQNINLYNNTYTSTVIPVNNINEIVGGTYSNDRFSIMIGTLNSVITKSNVSANNNKFEGA
jgi:hypothetical protein